jgi:GNAT superfamily N-acetyltransferase
MGSAPEVRQLEAVDIGLLGEIDRSEQLDTHFRVVEGELIASPDDFFIPPWDPAGEGEYSVAAMIKFAEPIVRGGANLLGAYRDEELLGLGIVEPAYEREVAWLALLYVTRTARRSGAASALWAAAARLAREAAARTMYVSSAPTGSAVGFYLSRGCRLAAKHEIIPALFDLEPEDVHLVYDLALPA